MLMNIITKLKKVSYFSLDKGSAIFMNYCHFTDQYCNK